VYYPSRDGNGESPWEDFPELPEPMFGFGAASVADSIFLIEGLSDLSEKVNPLTTYQFKNENWKVQEIKINLGNKSDLLVPLDSQIYVFFVSSSGLDTSFWSYVVYFYEIFVPVVQ